MGTLTKADWEEYERRMAARNDDDYEFNREQGLKLFAAFEFFESYVRQYGGRVEPINLIPREENGGLTCYCTVFDFAGTEIQQFCTAILGASALSIDALSDGTVCLSMTFPDVFVRKK